MPSIRIRTRLPFLLTVLTGNSFDSCGATASRPLPKTQPLQLGWPRKKGKKDVQKRVGEFIPAKSKRGREEGDGTENVINCRDVCRKLS